MWGQVQVVNGWEREMVHHMYVGDAYTHNHTQRATTIHKETDKETAVCCW